MTQILIIGYTSLVILSGNVAATDLGNHFGDQNDNNC